MYRVKAVGLSLSNYTFKIKIFMSMWNLRVFDIFDIKIDILSITAELKANSKNPFALMGHISLQLSAAHHISFPLNRFPVKYRFDFPFFAIFTVKPPSVTERYVSQNKINK